MDATKRGIIVLLKSAITGEALPLPEEFDMQNAAGLLRKRGLVTLGYAGAVNCGIDPDMPCMLQLQELYLQEYYRSDCQLKRLQSIFDAFEENGIDYMPLKGTIMKGMYPSHEMRPMCDADVLIRVEQREKLDKIMQQLEFLPLSESDHEWNWSVPELKLELHKRLVSSDDKDYYNCLGEGWQLAKHQNGCRWELTAEDAYIFEFVHFSRHYCTTGVSIRHIVDLWMHLRSGKQMNEDYIRQKLETMQLWNFYGYAMQLVQAWFEDGVWDERTEFISDFIFSGGQTQAVSDRARAVQNTGDVKAGNQKMLLRKVFPAKKHIKWNYPQLSKMPLPIAWVVRWFLLLTVRRESVHAHTSRMQSTSDEQVAEYLRDLESVGLKFSE